MAKHIKSTYKTIVKGHDQHYTDNEKEHQKMIRTWTQMMKENDEENDKKL